MSQSIREQYLAPSFYIMGERKCGTSSLYRYLVAHPNVLPCHIKEPQFFSKHSPDYIREHIEEYFALFPTETWKGDLEFVWPELNEDGILYHMNVSVPRKQDQQYFTGEASANTFCEVEPSLLYEYLPDIKLILLLRNPVDRAFSHYRMYKRFQEEGRDLGFLVRDFEAEVYEEMTLIREGEGRDLLGPGIYLNQLKKWEAVYPKEQIRIFLTEDLEQQESAIGIFDEIQKYIGIPHHDMSHYLKSKFNQAPPAAMDQGLRTELEHFFRPFNQQLEQHLKRELPW